MHNSCCCTAPIAMSKCPKLQLLATYLAYNATITFVLFKRAALCIANFTLNKLYQQIKSGRKSYVFLIISKSVFYEIEDGVLKLEPNANLLFIVIIDVGFARKCLSTANCAAQKISAKTDQGCTVSSNANPNCFCKLKEFVEPLTTF